MLDAIEQRDEGQRRQEEAPPRRFAWEDSMKKQRPTDDMEADQNLQEKSTNKQHNPNLKVGNDQRNRKPLAVWNLTRIISHNICYVKYRNILMGR